jgi:subtilisin family serine protease
MKRYECGLFPFEREDVLSIQDAKQRAGWNITAFNLPKAWKHAEGENVKIAVLDTGCDLNHSDLKNNLLTGINFVTAGQPPDDKNGHGSHASGIICAQNNEIGMVGVAPKCKVIPVKVLDDNGAGNLIHVANGIRWAVDNGADIISMSLGAPSPIQQVRKAIQYAAKKNIPIFVAAGNAGQTNNIFYPARYPETISIGSIDENMERSNFSNTGPNLDFMAPGGKIFSTVNNNWYAILSGTSMACPFAAGVAALLLSYKRKKGKASDLNNVDSYKNELKKYTTKITGDTFFEGMGIIDPRKVAEWIESKS